MGNDKSLDLDMTVMAVDDSSFMMKLFIRNLTKIGFKNIITAVHGMDALEKMEKNKVDLIISDWNMPEMNGLALLKNIREDARFNNIPFIMATAQGDKAKQLEAMNAGANGHIAKPFTSEQLHETIDEAFGLKEELVVHKRERTITKGKVAMKMGHIQITDHLALGVLKYQIQTFQVKPKFFDLETICMPGWNPIQQGLEKSELDGAFVLAPIAMDIFAYNVPISLILLAHKNGSIFVRSAKHELVENGSVEDIYYNRVINIPHKMSVHNMLAHKFLTGLGLSPGVPGEDENINVHFEVIPPIQMPQIMKENDEVAGFIVAEPIGSNAIARGIARLQFLSSSIWEDHPCCVVTFQQDFIKEHTDAVYEFSSLLAKAGKFIKENREKAAEIAISFLDPQGTLGLTKPTLLKVLLDPHGIKMDNLYPKLEDLDIMQRYMHTEMGIGKIIDLEKFVDIRFADVAC